MLYSITLLTLIKLTVSLVHETPDAGPSPVATAEAGIEDAGIDDAGIDDASEQKGGEAAAVQAASPAVPLASGTEPKRSDALETHEEQSETPKQRRKRERRERWRGLAGIFGDTLSPGKKAKQQNKADAGADDVAGPTAAPETSGTAPPGAAATPDVERPRGDDGKRKRAHPKGERDPQGNGGAPEARDTVSDDATEEISKGWKLRPPQLRGFIQAHFRQPFKTGSDPLVDFNNFRVQRVRIGVDGELFPWLGYTVEIDPRAPEIVGVLRDAYVEVKAWHQKLRFGQQKTAFGWENSVSSTELYVVNRAEISDALGRGSNLRDVGIGLHGHVPFGKNFRLEDAITLTNGAGLNVQADNTGQKNLWGRLGGRLLLPQWGDLDAALGVSGGIGDFIDPYVDANADGINDVPGETITFRRVGVDAEVDQQWLFVAVEFMQGFDSVGGVADPQFGFSAIAVGKTPWSVGPLARFDSFGRTFSRGTFGAYWGLPGDALRLMLNYELRLLKDGVRSDDKLYLAAQVEF